MLDERDAKRRVNIRLAKVFAIFCLLIMLIAHCSERADATSDGNSSVERTSPGPGAKEQSGLVALFFPAGSQTTGKLVEFAHDVEGTPVINLETQDGGGGVGLTVGMNLPTISGFSLTGHLDYPAGPQGKTITVHFTVRPATQTIQ